MALIKQKEQDNTAVFGEYWKIVAYNNSSHKNIDGVFDIHLFANADARNDNKNALSEGLKFNMRSEDDNHVKNMDPALVDVNGILANNTIDDWTMSLEVAIRYAWLKWVAGAAQAKLDENPDAELTANEQNALFFVDAVDA